MLNRVTLIGNLGRDPELRELESGTKVTKFSLATNESYRDKNGEWQTITEWHDVICWRMLAERAERDLRKGSLVYVEGKITTRKWQDRDGNDRYSTEIVANTFKLLERRENRESTGRFPSEADELKSAPVIKETSSPVKDFSSEEDDDLPF